MELNYELSTLEISLSLNEAKKSKAKEKDKEKYSKSFYNHFGLIAKWIMDMYRNESQWAQNKVFHSVCFSSISAHQFWIHSNAYWTMIRKIREILLVLYLQAIIIIFNIFNFSPHEWWSSLNTFRVRMWNVWLCIWNWKCTEREREKWRDRENEAHLVRWSRTTLKRSTDSFFAKRRLMEIVCANDQTNDLCEYYVAKKTQMQNNA